MTVVSSKAGRPKGLRVAVCTCGWRVTGKGRSGTCVGCKRRVLFPQVSKSKTKAAA